MCYIFANGHTISMITSRSMIGRTYKKLKVLRQNLLSFARK